MHLKSSLALLGAGLGLCLSSASSWAAENCAIGKTLKTDLLIIGTGSPTYSPWVVQDQPESGKGFEAAVASEVATRLGFPSERVSWIRTSFDEALRSGEKNFDINLQQFSITEERQKSVDFSTPYYSAAMAVLVNKSTQDNGAKPDLASLKQLIWGAADNTTAMSMLKDLKPAHKSLLFEDTDGVIAALKAHEIEAALFDFPTALYLGIAVLDDGVVLGQFPADRTENTDQLGILMAKGNPLKACVDEVLAAMTTDGKLEALQHYWLQSAEGVPVIEQASSKPKPKAPDTTPAGAQTGVPVVVPSGAQPAVAPPAAAQPVVAAPALPADAQPATGMPVQTGAPD